MMKPGSLLQYKEKHHGWYYPSLPKELFAKHYLLPSIHNNVFDVFNDIKAGRKVDTSRKKYVLISAEKVELVHSEFPVIKCAYFKCFISDPYSNNETIGGWIREEWVEPLSENSTYREDNLEHVRSILNRMKKTHD